MQDITEIKGKKLATKNNTKCDKMNVSFLTYFHKMCAMRTIYIYEPKRDVIERCNTKMGHQTILLNIL